MMCLDSIVDHEGSHGLAGGVGQPLDPGLHGTDLSSNLAEVRLVQDRCEDGSEVVDNQKAEPAVFKICKETRLYLWTHILT